MQNKISTLFYIKRSKPNSFGQVPIYFRVTVNGVRFEMSTTKFIEPAKWSTSTSKVKGLSEEANLINSYLAILSFKVFTAETNLIKKGQEVNAQTIKNELLGIQEKKRTLVPIFELHNKNVESLIGNGFAHGTLERYKTSLKHTVDFIGYKYNLKDIELDRINHEFITDYEFYLRTVRKCNNNSAVKYIKNFKKIIRTCIANGWLEKDPFVNYKSKVHEVEIDFLDEQQLNAIYNKTFATERLNLVKDIYIFCCFTGLAYIDIKQLTKHKISTGIDGNKWIFTYRQKTDTASKIPLLPIAEEIMEKYSSHPQCINENKVLPVLSNQKMNSYLKEIADVCGINKKLTFHTARHTFATTVTLSNGVPIESVSKMLGHTNIKTTQHYAKILDRKVSEDMLTLKNILSNKTAQTSAQKII